MLEETLKRPAVTAAAQSPIDKPAAESAPRSVSTPRVLYLDVLRIISAIAVICIHTSADILYIVALRPTIGWRVALALNSASRWCVPVYVLLSGALMLPYRRRYSTAQFVQKRLIRIVVPFAAWSIIYLVWQVVLLHSITIHGISDWRTVWNALAMPAYAHLWFFYMIIGLYLATPILSVLIEHASRKLLWSLVVMSFIGSTWATQAEFTHLYTSFVAYFPLSSEMAYVGYFVLGYLLVSSSAAKAKLMAGLMTHAVIYVLALASFAVTVYTTYHLSATTYNDPLAQYVAPTTLFETLGVFLFCRSIPWYRVFQWSRGRTLLTTLALATFGVYLIHILVKYWFNQMTAQVLPLTSIRYQLTAPVLLFAISAAIILVMRRLPIVKSLVP